MRRVPPSLSVRHMGLMMDRKDILEAATTCVTVDRAATHGRVEDNFAWIAGHWNWWLQDKLEPGASITPYDVAQMMVGFKQARAKGNPAHMDSHCDAVGYAALAGEIAQRATERPATAPQAPSAAATTRQPTPGLYEAPTRLRRGYERTPL